MKHFIPVKCCKLAAILLVFIIFNGCTAFGQKISYDVPARYNGKISGPDYRKIVDRSVDAVTKQLPIEELSDGIITVGKGADRSELGLDNLVLQCLATNKGLWDSTVAVYFETLFSIPKEQAKVDLTSFKSAKSYLSLRVYPEDFFTQMPDKEQIISRIDLEGTLTVLMLDLPSSFQAINRESISGWKVTDDELFAAARENLSKQPVLKETKNIDIDGKGEVELNLMEEENYCASYALELERNAPEFVGKWGSAVAMPNKGFVTICKISKEKPLDFIRYIQKSKAMTANSYASMPGGISPDFYWYYKGKYTKIQVSEAANGDISVVAPLKLSEMMKE